MIPHSIFSLKHFAYELSIYRKSVPCVKMGYKLIETCAGYVKRVSVMTVMNKTKDLFLAWVIMLVITTTCFGHHVAIFRLNKYEEKNI
jgi:hypothetical protein